MQKPESNTTEWHGCYDKRLEGLITRKSFFRRLAEKKGSPEINFEEVIICRRQ